MGIEKVIGNRWKAMTAEEKEKHIDKARVEQARLIAEGGIPQQSGSGRSKKQKANAASDPVPKRRRGRPPKTTGVSQRKSSPTNRQGNAFARWRVQFVLDVHASIRVIITITITTLTKIAIRSVTTITTI